MKMDFMTLRWIVWNFKKVDNQLLKYHLSKRKRINLKDIYIYIRGGWGALP